MQQEINFLNVLPSTKRNVAQRAKKTPEDVAIAKQYGAEYFDGDRRYGYGGYKYDGRWAPVAAAMIRHYDLKPGAAILDVGCAKGFLIAEFMKLGMYAQGVDISMYALNNAHPTAKGRIYHGTADSLPFKDNMFDLVVSINTIHNLPRPRAIRALQEIMRVTNQHAFVQVDSYYTRTQRETFEDWVLTAEYHDYPEGWLRTFSDAGYLGDYYWTVV